MLRVRVISIAVALIVSVIAGAWARVGDAAVMLSEWSAPSENASSDSDEQQREFPVPGKQKAIVPVTGVAGGFSNSSPRGLTDGGGNFLPPIHNAEPSPLVTFLPAERGIQLPPALESGLFRPPRGHESFGKSV